MSDEVTVGSRWKDRNDKEWTVEATHDICPIGLHGKGCATMKAKDCARTCWGVSYVLSAWTRLPDQPAAGEVKGPRVGEWYRSAPGGELAQVTAIDDTQRFPVTVRWHKTTAYSDLTRGAFGPGEYFTGPVPGPDEGKAGAEKAEAVAPVRGDGLVTTAAHGGEAAASVHQTRTEPQHDFSDPYAVRVYRDGAGVRQVVRACKVCGSDPDDNATTCKPTDWRAYEESLNAQLTREGCKCPECTIATPKPRPVTGPPAPMRSGLGALACGMNVVKHGVKR